MPEIEEQKSGLAKTIELEIADYFGKEANISQDQTFSQPKLVRRISLFESKIYPTGKFDSQGNYKAWYDIISPRVESEIKNIDFDTKNIEAYSPRRIDEVPSLIVNLKNREWLRDHGQAEELNSAIEEGSGWGNVVWKKVKGTYERVDLKNFYVINQTAQTLKQSAVIERHQLTQSELRELSGKYEYVDQVIRSCGCGIGSWGGLLGRPASESGCYVKLTATTDGPTAAGGCSCCLSSETGEDLVSHAAGAYKSRA